MRGLLRRRHRGRDSPFDSAMVGDIFGRMVDAWTKKTRYDTEVGCDCFLRNGGGMQSRIDIGTLFESQRQREQGKLRV